MAKKAEEFPDDDQTSNDLGAAETNILLLRDELLVMAQSTEVSVREADGIERIATDARYVEAYNRIYAQALPIARSADPDALAIYFEAIDGTLKEAEKQYNFAVAESKADATERGVEFAEALNDYTAGLDVQFDVVEAVEQENLLPGIVLTEDDEDALNFPIDAARSVEGGASDVQFRLMQLFDEVIEKEFDLQAESGDAELQEALARAREHYRWTKEYALETAAEQAGATPEEIAAAQRAASGEPEPLPVVEIDQDLAAQLEAEIAAQRAEEQRIKLAKVEAAQAELDAANAEAERLAKEQAEKEAAAAAAAAEKEKADALYALIQE